MLIGYGRPAATWTVSGTGATIVGPAANLGDGRPDTLSAFTWLTGTQTTSSVFHLRADWTTGAIVPGIVGLSNCSLPVGTKITVSFRRVGDTAGTYPYAPSLLNTGNLQRIVAGPRGEKAAWLIVPAGATAVVGVDIAIWNDVNGSASIVASAAWTLGEAVVAPTFDVPVMAGASLDTIDPTTISYSRTNQPYTVPGCPYRQLTFRFVTGTGYFGGSPATTLAAIDRGQSAVYVLDYTTAGAFDAALLHNTAIIGVATKLPTFTQTAGAIYTSGPATVIESPIPT